MLVDEDVDVRRKAAWALSEMPRHCTACEPDIRNALADGDEQVRAFAQKTLESIEKSGSGR